MKTEDHKSIPLFVDKCIAVYPNNGDSQEIEIIIERLSDRQRMSIIFNPEDWLDTFTPSMFNHIKKNYIKYIEEIE